MKNEKAYIVALAYLIGFTTAFIGFGLSQGSVPTPAPQVALVTHATTSPEVSRVPAVLAEVQSDGLAVTVDGKQYTVPPYIFVDEEAEVDFGEYAAFAVNGSADGRFVSYCEQSLENEAECSYLVYDTQEQIVWPVGVVGEQVVVDSTASAGEWVDGLLMVAGYVSVSPDTPWILE